MTTEKTFQGAWRVSDIIGNQRVSIVYFYTSKREAMSRFKTEVEERKRLGQI